MKTFAIINQKGGTGKTTVAINLAARLAEQGRRILLLDIDPQGNATSGSGVDKWKLFGGTYEVLSGSPAWQYPVSSIAGGYCLLGANAQLAGADIELAQTKNWQTRLKQSLLPLSDKFDFVLIDCPPALGILTINALVAAERVLIPMQCEYFALEGLSDLAETVRRLRKKWNPSLRIAGIIRARVGFTQSFVTRYFKRTATAFWRTSFFQHHQTQCQSRRSAQPRIAGVALRPAFGGRGRVSATGR